jgi:hypothetical protein
VVGWIDGNAISLPSGASLALQSELNIPISCDATLFRWLTLGLTPEIQNDTDREYANGFLLKNSANSEPPQLLDPASFLAAGDFRLFSDIKAKFRVVDGLIMDPHPIGLPQTVVGKTPDPCRLPLASPANAEPHPDNGRHDLTPSRTTYFLLASGRLGSRGQTINAEINGRTTPWIHAVTKFNSQGAYGLDLSIFPRFTIYENLARVSEPPQGPPGPFIALDDSYQTKAAEIQ